MRAFLFILCILSTVYFRVWYYIYAQCTMLAIDERKKCYRNVEGPHTIYKTIVFEYIDIID